MGLLVPLCLGYLRGPPLLTPGSGACVHLPAPADPRSAPLCHGPGLLAPSAPLSARAHSSARHVSGSHKSEWCSCSRCSLKTHSPLLHGLFHLQAPASRLPLGDPLQLSRAPPLLCAPCHPPGTQGWGGSGSLRRPGSGDTGTWLATVPHQLGTVMLSCWRTSF